MDILEEIEETIKEKKSKWNYTPMRGSDETDAIINLLLLEYPEGRQTKPAPRRSSAAAPSQVRQEAPPPQPPAPEPPPEPEVAEEEYEEPAPQNQDPLDNEKTMIFSRSEINEYEEKAYEQGDTDEEYEEDEDYEDEEYYEEEYEDNGESDGRDGGDNDYEDLGDSFDEFMDSEDDFESMEVPFSIRGLFKTIFKIIFTAIIAGFIVTGILTTVNYLIERRNFGSQTGIVSSSESENPQFAQFKKILSPAVAADIDDFDNLERLPSDSKINTSVLEIMLNGDISGFKDPDSDEIMIPESQMQNIIERLFGEKTKFENLNTKINGSKIKYDKSQEGYIIPEEITIMYTPEIKDISQADTGVYSVLVEYVSDSQSDSGSSAPAKKKMFTLKKTSDYYCITAVKTVS